MVVRDATAADLPALVALVRGAFEEYRGRLDPPSGADTEDEVTLGKALARGSAALACVDDAIVGCVFYHREDDAVCFGRLSVAPAFRRRGIAKALTGRVERRAQELGARRVRLGVRLALPFLQTYYERLGYRVVRRERHPGYWLPTYAVMEKRLG